MSCLALPAPAPPKRPETVEAKRQREAVAELDNWDEPTFARARATLERHFPAAAEYVFANLQAASGSAAVKSVATFLARLGALEAGSDPARADSRADDKNAVALLEKRGITAAERQRVHQLVELALAPTGLVDAPPGADPTERRAKLVALKAWYSEWAETARALVKKRAHLIRLGLATRRASQPSAEGAAGGEPA
ncbi:MAG: hypothetical protein HY744_33005 [Deltaproteobacteria bacterium]|nr:hypothetical protein [Deltaproteobacteria bacterium]